MKINYENSFLKDLEKLNDKTIKNKLKELLELFEACMSLDSISNIKKLKGFDGYYRMRIGNYRLGFYFNNNEVTMIRFIHRKDIYRKFP